MSLTSAKNLVQHSVTILVQQVKARVSSFLYLRIRVIELASDGWEYRGIWPCVSRAHLAQHVEGRRIPMGEGVPGWYGPPGLWGPHKTRYQKTRPACPNDRYRARCTGSEIS